MTELLHMRPEFAAADLADVELREAEMLRDTALRPAVSFEASNASDRRLVDRGVAVRFAASLVQKAELLGAFVVDGLRHVLQVCRPIVFAITIDVVNLVTFGATTEERFGDEGVDKGRTTLALSRQRDSWVFSYASSAAHQRRPQYVARLAAVTVKASHAPTITNLVQSLVAGHRLPRLLEGVASPLRLLHTQKGISLCLA